MPAEQLFVLPHPKLRRWQKTECAPRAPGGSGEPFHSRFVSRFYRHLAVVDLPIESDIIASRAKRIGLKIHIAQLLYVISHRFV